MKVSILAAVIPVASLTQGRGLGIPTVPFQAQSESFPLTDITRIVVDINYSGSRDTTGLTLIPPSLDDFAHTFAEDLHNTLGIHVQSAKGGSHQDKAIFLTIDKSARYLDSAGRHTAEGYTLTTNSSGIFITGASALGVWWGTRTVLQQAALHPSGDALPYGTGSDAPGWATRGMMLDCGRRYYPKEFLIEMCAYMSFFKQNVFHVHLSDNLFVTKQYSREQALNLGAWFRLLSNSDSVNGLNKHPNESYTRQDFDEIQSKCAARGVAILPEIEAPGHALPIVQWRPQIGYAGDFSLLNISHPDAIPTMKTIWGEFLPWFHSKVVSIGADEYTGPAGEYNTFVNEMNDFIRETSNKSTRIWGTFPPKYNSSYNNIKQDVSIQHWEYFEDNPYYDYIRNNYSVVNSNDDYYIVNKYGGYKPTIDISKTFHGDPAVPGGGLWYPYILSQKNASDNPKRSEPLILGGIEPLWNDYGGNTSVYSEAYYAWRRGLPALADKLWGGNLEEDEFEDVFAKLHPRIPAQNLDRAIPSKGDTIFEYKFDGAASAVVKDSSPNGYDATTTCRRKNGSLNMTPSCSLTTPWSSKGRDYTLSLSLKIDSLADPTNTTLIAGSDSVLMLTPNITLFASGNYYRLNRTVPLHEWIELSIRGSGNRTFASVARKSEKVQDEFLTKIGLNARGFHWDIMAIEAPIEKVTGWTGQLRSLELGATA